MHYYPRSKALNNISHLRPCFVACSSTYEVLFSSHIDQCRSIKDNKVNSDLYPQVSEEGNLCGVGKEQYIGCHQCEKP